jgi:prefoldin beta subunit
VSEDISKLPPQVQERLLRYQQVQQTLQSVLAQKQQVDVELTEIEQALTELQKAADDATIYKSIGTLLVKGDKTKITTELNERKELLNTRTTVLGKQEERLRAQFRDLETKLKQDFNPVSTPQP